VEKGCILKIEHPLSSIDGACKVGKMIIVEKVSICGNNVGYSPKMEGYATLMSDINELYAIVSKVLNKREDIMRLKHMHTKKEV